MMRKREGIRGRLFVLATAILLAGGSLLLVPEVSGQQRPDPKSVRHSSKSKQKPAARTVGKPATKPTRPGAPTTRDRRAVRAGARAGYRAGRYDARYAARKDAWRDYRRWRTVNHLLRLGAYYATRPRSSTTIVVSGSTYYYCGGVYYASSGAGYVVVSAPVGAVVHAVPTYTTVVYAGATPYYYSGGTYYVATSQPAPQPPPAETHVNVNVSVEAAGDGAEEFPEVPMTEDEHNYEVVAPPVGATVPYLPDEADEETVGGKMYLVYDGTYYQPFQSEGETIYMVVEDPR
jgi:hypothetical protein